MSALYQLQVAVVARLKGDSGVAALVGAKVFDAAAPDGTAAPWITVDDLTGAEEGGTLEKRGYGHTITVHAFASDLTGNEAVAAVATAAKSALSTALSISGHVAARLKLDFETVLVEPNKRHANMRFRTLALEA